jgi:hypothetical protein
MNKTIYIIFSFFVLYQMVIGEVSVKIINKTGNAKVRFGLEEEWKNASVGIDLKEIDSILTGENGKIVLQFQGGKKFILGSNAILDIGDLREIQEKELFLFLMSKKVNKIKPRKEKTKLRIGDVSVVHGESKAKTDTLKSNITKNSLPEKKINGALALFMQKYYTNTLYKLHNFLEKYKSKIYVGKVYFYIAKAFEAINKKGQAMDAYQNVIDYFQDMDSLNQDNKEYLLKSKNALEKLKLNN